MFAIQSLSENTTSNKSQRNDVLKTLKDDYISNLKISPKNQRQNSGITYNVETIGLRQHSLKTKADFIKYELLKHNMGEKRPMTVSPPRDRARSSQGGSCCLVINLSGSKSLQLSGSKRHYHHQHLIERRTRSLGKRMQESLNETKQQITNIIIHKEAAPRPRVAPVPTAYASTANTTVVMTNDHHKPTRTRNIPKAAQKSQTMVISEKKCARQSKNTPYFSQLEQKYTMTKGKLQGLLLGGKKRASQTRRKVSVINDDCCSFYEDGDNKENARRKLSITNLSKFLTSPSQILQESKESQEKSHNHTSTVIQDLTLSIKNEGPNTSLLTNSFRSTVTSLPSKLSTGGDKQGVTLHGYHKACHPTRQLQRVITNSLSARKKRQQHRLYTGSSSEIQHRFHPQKAGEVLPARFNCSQESLTLSSDPHPIKQSSSPMRRESIQAMLALVETSSQFESRALALQCEELLFQQL